MIDSYRTYQAIDIASKTESVSREELEEKVSQYQENNWTYMPLLEEREYYNVDKDEHGEIESEQFISGGLGILETMKKSKNYPFLIINNESNLYIVTVSDLNNRKVKEMAYPIIGEMEELLAKHIKELYSSKELYEKEDISEKAKERWQKAKDRDVNLHLAEYLISYEMEKLVKNSQKLKEKTGLNKYNKPADKINEASQVRHKVAHGNRSLIYNKDRIEKVEKRLEHVQEINQTLR